MTRGSFAVAVLAMAASWHAADACGPDFLLRPSLSPRFWQPSVQLPADLLPDRPDPGLAYAGMASGPATPTLAAARQAYQAIARWRSDPRDWKQRDVDGRYEDFSLPAEYVDTARRAVTAALAARPPEVEAEELRLIAAKVTLREAESLRLKAATFSPEAAPPVTPELERAERELTAFVEGAHTPALLSEARGWLARIHYLRGRPHLAARVYLDELPNASSPLSSDTLTTSLHMVFPYNGSAANLAGHLDEYFDTPEHALFAVGLATNPVVGDEGERRAMAAVGRKALDALERHRGLFRKGGASDRLAVASMRASLYLGEPERALSIARALPAGSSTARQAEVRWMQGLAHVLLKQYAQAEPHLRAASVATAGPGEPRDRALLGLLLVYQKLNRPVDQLLAALRWVAVAPGGLGAHAWTFGWASMDDRFLDVSYLLDVQLTDAELRAARARVAAEGPREVSFDNDSHTALEAIDYALAVRAARRGDYARSAALYARLGVAERAALMKEAHRRCGTGARGPAGLQRRYDCAAFLADHTDEVYYNDRAWGGLQGWALFGLSRQGEPSATLLDEAEHTALLDGERRLQDAQEEQWRAFQMFDSIVREAGQSPLGRDAALSALECLRRLGDNPRFGRTAEIRAAQKRLWAWLKERPSRAGRGRSEVEGEG